jgi:hypothetical protein
MFRSILVAACFASVASLGGLATGCASAPKAAPAAPVQAEPTRSYDQAEYTAPEEREIFVSSPQESQVHKDVQAELSPSLVTQRKAKQLYPAGH